MSGRQVHNTHAVTPVLSHPAGGRDVSARREGVPDHLQHVRSAGIPLLRATVRQRSQQHAQGHVSARKHPHDACPDLPHVLDLG